jgi:hypothetical protein
LLLGRRSCTETSPSASRSTTSSRRTSKRASGRALVFERFAGPHDVRAPQPRCACTCESRYVATQCFSSSYRRSLVMPGLRGASRCRQPSRAAPTLRIWPTHRAVHAALGELRLPAICSTHAIGLAVSECRRWGTDGEPVGNVSWRRESPPRQHNNQCIA